jgi:hypothetical protein
MLTRPLMPADVSNPSLPPDTPITISTPEGLVLGIDPQTGLMTFVDPATSAGSAIDTFTLVNAVSPTSAVDPGDPVVIMTSTGEYCVFDTSQATSCDATPAMNCSATNIQDASQLTYTCVAAGAQ